MIIFLGVGASKPFGIPTMRELTSNIKNKLENAEDKKIIKIIENSLKAYNIIPDVESILTILIGISDDEKAVKEYGPLHNFMLTKIEIKSKDYRIVQERSPFLMNKIIDYVYEMCNIRSETFANNLVVYDRLFNYLIRTYQNFLYHEENGMKFNQILFEETTSLFDEFDKFILDNIKNYEIQ